MYQNNPMTNLKINSTSTPYWCVVVPVDAEDFLVIKEFKDHKNISELSYWYNMEWVDVDITWGDWSILGCITSSGMDEGVREMVRKADVVELYMDYMNNVFDTFRFRKPHESALSLLTHNQITLTAEQKAVVVKQIT